MMLKSMEEVLKNLDEKFILAINELVLEYVKNNKLVNQIYIDKLVSLFKKEYHLEKYLKKAIIVTDDVYNPNDSAGYSFILKKITIHLNCFLNEILNMAKLFNLNANDIIYLIYTYFNKIVFHEIAHSYQLLEIKEGNNFDSKILKASFKFTTKLEYFNLFLPDKIRELSSSLTNKYNQYIRRVNIYYSYYSCAPEERLAEYFANDLTLTLIKKLKEKIEINKLDNMYQYILLKNLLEGYNKNLNPTYFYLNKLGEKIELPSIYDMSLDRRLKYGLEITKKEYGSLKRLKSSMYESLKS